MRAALLLVSLPLLMAACSTDGTTAGTTPGATPGTTAGATAGATGSAAATELTITVRESVAAEPVTYTLTCDPVGGDHPDPAAACAALEAARTAALNPLDPVPPTMACTEIYGGEQTAVIEGTLEGEPVRTELSRVNGCEIARWDSLVPVVVVPGGV
jgi:hypothetical protein